MRILIANDKFKGSLPAEKAAFHLRNSLERLFPWAIFDLCPIADGGEGTALAMTTALAGEWVSEKTCDAHGRPIEAPFGWVPGSATAVMEMSAASGLAIVQDIELKPFKANTLGTGILLKSALRRGAKRILIGIGGAPPMTAVWGSPSPLGTSSNAKARTSPPPSRPSLKRIRSSGRPPSPPAS
jgi:glycerate kinase